VFTEKKKNLFGTPLAPCEFARMSSTER